MAGDFSRNTFDKKKHYSSVRMQQGRVQLDADWNEQMDILGHRLRSEAHDFIGGSGAPEAYAGFSVSPVELRIIRIKDDYIYAVDNLKNLQIIKIESTNTLTTIANYALPGYAMDIAVSDHYVYIAMGIDGLRILNIESPKNPIEVAGLSINAHRVAVTGRYVCVIEDGKLSVLNVRESRNIDPSKPVNNLDVKTIKSISGLHEVSDIIVHSNSLYIVDKTKLYIIKEKVLASISDINDSAVSSIGGMIAANKIAISGNYAYVTDKDKLHIMDISKPSMLPTSVAGMTYATTVTVSGDYIYIVDGTSLQIINSDISKPTIVNTINDFEASSNIVFSDKCMYVATNKAGLHVFKPEVDGGIPTLVEQSAYAEHLSIGAGRYYVNGLLCENDEAIGITQQADLIVDKIESLIHSYDDSKKEIVTPSELKDGCFYLAYLEAWQRDISGLEDPAILEPALSGTDTTTRIQNISQVKLLALEGGSESDPSVLLNNTSNQQAWNRLTAQSTGRLNVRVRDSADLQDQLYRVEIHQGGSEQTASFKWARDNSSIAANFTVEGNEVVLSDFSLEKMHQFKDIQWIELTNDKLELERKPGELFRLSRIKNNRLIIENGDFDVSKFTKIRAWNITDIKSRLVLTDYIHLSEVERVEEEGHIVLTLNADEVLPPGITEGQFIELTNQEGIKRHEEGYFTQIKSIEGSDTLIVRNLQGTNKKVLKTLNQFRLSRSAEKAHTFIPLENGIEIQFTAGNYASGDYWLIPSRALTNNVEWPQDKVSKEFIAQLPLGIERNYACLAILQRKNTTWVLKNDCRTLFSGQVAKAYQADAGAPGRSLYVDNFGNLGVGLGANAPQGKLHVNGGIPGTGTISSKDKVVTGIDSLFQKELAVGDIIIVGNDARTITNIASNTDLNINDHFSADLSNQSYLIGKKTIVENSNVGIGTDTPEANLHVDGKLKLQVGNAVNEISDNINITSDDANYPSNVIPTVKAIQDYIDSLFVGTVSAFAMKEAPKGWLVCDGKVYKQKDYHRLYEKIGDTFKGNLDDNRNLVDNNGNPVTVEDDEFRVPDLSGEFIRGWDDKREVDKNRTFGQFQNHAFQVHAHTVEEHNHGGWTVDSGEHQHLLWEVVYNNDGGIHILRDPAPSKNTYKFSVNNKLSTRLNKGEGIHNHVIKPDAGKIGKPIKLENQDEPRTSHETRPRNIALLFCIKY